MVESSGFHDTETEAVHESLCPKTRTSRRHGRPYVKQASFLAPSVFEPNPLFQPVRANHKREDPGHFFSADRDPPIKDNPAFHRRHDSSKERTAYVYPYAADASSDSGDCL